MKKTVLSLLLAALVSLPALAQQADNDVDPNVNVKEMLVDPGTNDGVPSFGVFSVTVPPPELPLPGTLALLGVGLIGLGLSKRSQ